MEERARERFDSKICIDNNCGCWRWTAAIGNHGYGVFGYLGKTFLAHRISYEIHKGPIPEGLQIDHLCKNIVNGTRMRAKTHCPHGHPYSGDNLYLFPDGRRKCRHCGRDDYHKRKKARK